MHEKIIDEIYDRMEIYGGVTLYNKGEKISIVPIDDKEGYSFIASRYDAKFNDGKIAVKWAIDELNGVESWE